MTYASPVEFSGVTAVCKANLFFDGKVVSHTVRFADGSRKSLGLIYPGAYRFDVGTREKMEIVAGTCRVRVGNGGDWIGFVAGTWFDVPENSFFEIEVADGIVEYVCSFG